MLGCTPEGAPQGIVAPQLHHGLQYRLPHVVPADRVCGIKPASVHPALSLGCSFQLALPLTHKEDIASVAQHVVPELDVLKRPAVGEDDCGTAQQQELEAAGVGYACHVEQIPAHSLTGLQRAGRPFSSDRIFSWHCRKTFRCRLGWALGEALACSCSDRAGR